MQRGRARSSPLLSGSTTTSSSWAPTPWSAWKYLNDSKRVSPRRRARLLAAICDLADDVAIAVISAAEIDDDRGHRRVDKRALARVLQTVAVPDSVNVVDWYQVTGADGWSAHDLPQRVKGGDGKSAAIAAASIVAKETRDQLMRGLDVEYPGCGFAGHKGYGGGKGEHEAALRALGKLSPAHRQSMYPNVHAELGLPAPRLARAHRPAQPTGHPKCAPSFNSVRPPDRRCRFRRP